MVRWLDGRETMFDPSETPGDYCNHSSGKDCELRATGPTPLAGSLQSIEDYVVPIRSEDAAASCRGYSMILVTDGAESCNGDPVAAAAHLKSMGVNVNVVAVSVLDNEKASLNAIAAAGGTTAATFVTAPEQLVPALTGIIAGAIRTESCNGADDDCDGKIDEDFPGLGAACDDHMKGVCRGEGAIACNDAHDGTECKITSPGQPAEDEKCNEFDDDCDGKVDEGLDCNTTNCTKTGDEICNNKDDDCDGKVDETDPAVGTACGSTIGECKPGMMRCVNGSLHCIGESGMQAEQCNGKDDDCDGTIDNDAPCPGETACIEGACRNRCGSSEFTCPVGQLCEHSEVYGDDYCLPRACALCKSNEQCMNDVCVDLCADVHCDNGLLCVRGQCRDCNAAGCPSGQICYQQLCQEDKCAGVSCDAGQFCFDGNCMRQCSDSQCPAGQSCNTDGECAEDPCAAISCGENQVCRGGQCADDPCRTMACPLGKVCVTDMGCVNDPCTVTMCPDNALCSVDAQGAPRCMVPGARKSPPHYFSTGGGLGSCSVGAVGSTRGGAGWALFMLLAFGVSARRRKRALVAAAGLAALLGGCRTDAICLDCTQNPGYSNVGDGGPIDSGGKIVEGPDANYWTDGGGAGGAGGNGRPPLTCTQLGDEVCNHLDDDCDGNTDEDFDFMTNVLHCGGCDQVCQAANAETACEDGECKVKDCLAGFADNDPDMDGCEYRCPVFPAAAEDCNGIDDDCDGRIDEDLVRPSADRMCKHTKGTPCEDVQVVCKTREQKTTWFCDYPSSVDFDPQIPDGIRDTETRCDGIDNNCDGVADEAWPELGEPCDDGKIGACRDGGAMVCGQDQKSTRCDLSLAPDPLPGAGPDAPELCNDLDDNCDGIVDNSDPADAHRIVDSMVAVSHPGHNFYIYTYEASRPDASSSTAGITPSRACSKNGVQPWTYVSYAAANAACTSAGKRLCTGDEWQWACEGSGATAYPYGANYAAGSCNGAEHDTASDSGIQNAVIPTGSMNMCVSMAGAFDLSGNVKEWVNQAGSDSSVHVVRGGSFESPQLGLTCQTVLSQAVSSAVLPGLGFRCCSDSAP
jgi:hypothetical protein